MNKQFEFEVNPVLALDENGEPTQNGYKIVCYEQCEEDDPDIHMWSVYVRRHDWAEQNRNPLDCIIDCRTKDEAEKISDLLTANIEDIELFLNGWPYSDELYTIPEVETLILKYKQLKSGGK